MTKWAVLPAVVHAVWAGLAAGYYTPKRAVGTWVSGFVVRQLLGDYLVHLVEKTSRTFDSSLNPFVHTSYYTSRFEASQGPLR